MDLASLRSATKLQQLRTGSGVIISRLSVLSGLVNLQSILLHASMEERHLHLAWFSGMQQLSELRVPAFTECDERCWAALPKLSTITLGHYLFISADAPPAAVTSLRIGGGMLLMQPQQSMLGCLARQSLQLYTEELEDDPQRNALARLAQALSGHAALRELRVGMEMMAGPPALC